MPHLAALTPPHKADPIIEKTWEYRLLFSKDADITATVNFLQSHVAADPLCRNSVDPLPSSIWKKVVTDQFVDFQKLHASLDQGFIFDEEPKDLIAGLSIIRTEQAHAKRPITTESQWTRVFDAWMSAVLMVYPHRKDELITYRSFIIDVFRAAPNRPHVTIQLDEQARACYAKSPYHMDNYTLLNLPLLSQIMNTSSASPSSSKHPCDESPSPSSSKRPQTICRNWNLGICHGDICENRRRHGLCIECGGEHRARDVASCATALNASRPQVLTSKSSSA